MIKTGEGGHPNRRASSAGGHGIGREQRTHRPMVGAGWGGDAPRTTDSGQKPRVDGGRAPGFLSWDEEGREDISSWLR